MEKTLSSVLFNNRYARLGEDFFVKTRPVPVNNPGLIIFNNDLGDELGLSDTDLNSPDAVSFFAGNIVPDGAEPLAMAYSGHQFGHFNPQLGDGRAILLGQVTGSQGGLYDIHMKGTGQTAFSRNGDGRAALGPVLREYLVSEAMFKLGVPTTRALAAATTGEEVAREQLIPGGVITRVARSFVRVGTFQYFMSRNDVDGITRLADYVIEQNYAHARSSSNPYLGLLDAVIDRQAVLIAKWMQFGFIHGVMNTDNMSIAGETIDYGPCAFMDHYAHDQVYSSIDRRGRYAYNNQPSIGLWNLTRFAETLLPLLADDTDAAVEIAQEALKRYVGLYEDYWLEGMRKKTGLITPEEGDKALIDELLDIMAVNNTDFTLTFYYLSKMGSNLSGHDKDVWELFDNPEQFETWAIKWRERLQKQDVEEDVRKAKMLAVNPVYIPRNHQIEAAIRAAEDHNDFSVFHNLHDVLQKPYELKLGKDAYMLPPEPGEVVHQTFCGT
jgi:uncharacterized protein YdiU (UPF0061 family)